MRSTILCFLDNPDEFMLLYSSRMEETRENFEYDGAWKEEGGARKNTEDIRL